MNANRFFQADTALASTATVASVSEMNLGDIEQAAAQVQQVDYEIQQLETVSQQLDSLYDITESTVEDGGLSAQAFSVIRAQAASVMSFAGFNPVRTNMQSFEGGIADRQTGTNVTMLALKDTAKKVWDAIIKAIREAMQKVKTWFAKMTNAVPALIKKFEALRKQAADKTEGLKDDATITLSASEVTAVGTGKTPKITRDELINLASTLSGHKATVKDITKVIVEANKGASDAIGSADAGDGAKVVATVKNVSAFVKKYLDELGKMGDKIGTNNLPTAEKLGVGEETRVLNLNVGNQGFVFNIKEGMPADLAVDDLEGNNDQTVKDHVAALVKVAPAQLGVRNIVDKPEDADEFEFEALNSGQITSLCDDAIELLTDFKKCKEDQVKIDKERDDAIKKTESFASKAEKLKGPEGKEAAVRYVTDSAKAATSVVRQTGSLLPAYVSLAVRTSNVLLGVASKSYSAHK